MILHLSTRTFRMLLTLGFISCSTFVFSRNLAITDTIAINTLQEEIITNWTAEQNNRNVVLHWTSATENNLSHFIIQKSANGINYTDIAIFFAAEKGYTRTGYKYTDKLNPSDSTVYYRLKTQDLTGKNRLSDYLTVIMGNSTGEILSAVSPKKHR
ncbi:MAG: hypothetical protein WKF97_14050 [Chitinophagaceae bacterium]